MSVHSDLIIEAAESASAGNKLNFSRAMQEILGEYTDEVVKVVDEVLQEVGKKASDDLSANASQIGGFKDRTGKYRQSWTVTHETHRTFSSTVVHAKAPHYRLTHLLEYGHATSNGGRTKSFPHIYTINEDAQEMAMRKIMEAIEKVK